MSRHRAGGVKGLLALVIVWPSCAMSVANARGRVIGVDRGWSKTTVVLPLSVVVDLRATNARIVALTMVAGLDRR